MFRSIFFQAVSLKKSSQPMTFFSHAEHSWLQLIFSYSVLILTLSRVVGSELIARA